jgi:trehalose 6-phosphate phosphatase
MRSGSILTPASGDGRAWRLVVTGVSFNLSLRDWFEPGSGHLDRLTVAVDTPRAGAQGQDGGVPVTESAAAALDILREHLPRALIALDFDGTLAPIVADPAASRPAPGAVEALVALARAGAQLAIVTGRDARTTAGLGGFEAVPGLVIEGLYGAESWQAGELVAPAEPPAIGELRARLPGTLAAHTIDPQLWIEDKRLSLVVHARRTAQPGAAIEAVRGPVCDLAAQLGLETHDGRDVLEIRLPGYDKGAVLRRLVDRFEPAAVLFAGDDIGDLPAFAIVRELRAQGKPAWGVAATSAEVPGLAQVADLHVDGPTGVVALLTALGPGTGRPSGSSAPDG